MSVREDFLGLFADATDVRQVPAGQTVFEEGDEGSAMYVVLEGELSVHVGGQAMGVVGPGSIVGEMALIDESPRSASAVARSDCRLVAVDEQRFADLVRRMPRFALMVMKVMADRLRLTDAALGRPKKT